jgi:hypothetical protein
MQLQARHSSYFQRHRLSRQLLLRRGSVFESVGVLLLPVVLGMDYFSDAVTRNNEGVCVYFILTVAGL